MLFGGNGIGGRHNGFEDAIDLGPGRAGAFAAQQLLKDTGRVAAVGLEGDTAVRVLHFPEFGGLNGIDAHGA